jgi:hypothetical protein
MLLLRYSSITNANIRIPNRNIAIGRSRLLLAIDDRVLVVMAGRVRVGLEKSEKLPSRFGQITLGFGKKAWPTKRSGKHRPNHKAHTHATCISSALPWQLLQK